MENQDVKGLAQQAMETPDNELVLGGDHGNSVWAYSRRDGQYSTYVWVHRTKNGSEGTASIRG